MIHNRCKSMLFFSGFLLLLSGAALAGEPSSGSSGHGLDPGNIDAAIRPSQDFYQFANGGWLEKNPVPPEYGRYGSFEELIEKNYRDLHQILEDAEHATDAQRGSNLQKIGDFYASGMDSARAEAEGAKPLAGMFNRINGMKDIGDIESVIADLHLHGIGSLFGFSANPDAKKSTEVLAQLHQGGLGLPDRDYYTKEDERSKKIRDEYVAHVAAMFQLLGDDQSTSADEARTVLALETRLAKASMTRVERRDPNATYHKMSPGDVQDLTPTFAWKRYFTGLDISTPPAINVGQPAFFKEVAAMLKDVPVNDWKIYLRWHLIRDTSPMLSTPFVNEQFHFQGTILSGKKELQPRWKRVLEKTNEDLGEALGLLYVKKYFSPMAKARAKEMVENLRAAFRERIKTREWMSEETRVKALDKLDAFTVKIGYPDKWRDYSGLEIDRGSYVLNVLRADSFEVKRELNKIGKPVDRTEWGMTPPTVNAYYNPSMNEIVFPAGILQPPFFDPQADDAVNYGGMGSVIGHEMTHGFDDKGSLFDEKGNLRDWWQPQDKIAFAARTSMVEKEFDGFVAVDTMHVNGKLTLGENIADLGGLTIAYAALEKSLNGKPAQPLIDGYTQEQRFFLAWAQIWRANYRPEELRRRLVTDSHSPSRFRTIGPLENMPEFYKAFNIAEGDPMMRPQAVRAEIW